MSNHQEAPTHGDLWAAANAVAKRRRMQRCCKSRHTGSLREGLAIERITRRHRKAERRKGREKCKSRKQGAGKGEPSQGRRSRELPKAQANYIIFVITFAQRLLFHKIKRERREMACRLSFFCVS